MTDLPQGWAKRSGNQKIFKRKYIKKKLFFHLSIVKMFNIYVFIYLK